MEQAPLWLALEHSPDRHERAEGSLELEISFNQFWSQASPINTPFSALRHKCTPPLLFEVGQTTEISYGSKFWLF